MYPNPQEALPLPLRPSLEQYRKQAKELVRACKSSDATAVRQWATRWIEGLLRSAGPAAGAEQVRPHVDRVEAFARRALSTPRTCALADAQFVIARAQGFTSWPKFAEHLDALARANSPVSAFEVAADAIVTGDVITLDRLVRTNPDLIRARSTREHRATLLHYVAANGVENYRQKTPRNAVDVAELLLRAGAEVDAEADVYGGGATTLGLVATSVHPLKAGVQNQLIDVLVTYGARLDHQTGAGNRHNLVNGCLANGRRAAAEYLASRGAPLDLEGAAGVGQLEIVKSFFNDDGSLMPNATAAQMRDGFSWACEYGRTEVVEFLLDRGLDVNARLRPHQQTGLHWAAFGAHPDIVTALLRRGARVDMTDETFGTTPLMWALHGWGEEPSAPPDRYHEVVAALVAAGSVVRAEWLAHEKVRADAGMLAALSSPQRRPHRSRDRVAEEGQATFHRAPGSRVGLKSTKPSNE